MFLEARNGKTFVVCMNNGVMAFISKEDWELLKKLGETAQWGDMAEGDIIKVFTFCNSTSRMGFVTGSEDDMNYLFPGLPESFNMAANYYQHFYVPFSNGHEVGAHGEEAKASELKFRTRLKDVIKYFLA